MKILVLLPLSYRHTQYPYQRIGCNNAQLGPTYGYTEITGETQLFGGRLLISNATANGTVTNSIDIGVSGNNMLHFYIDVSKMPTSAGSNKIYRDANGFLKI